MGKLLHGGKLYSKVFVGGSDEVLDLPTLGMNSGGGVACFKTDLTENLIKAICKFNATQANGTPTPSSPITVTGVSAINVVRCGSNLCEEDYESGFINISGVETPSGTSIRSKNYNGCEPRTSYYAATFSDPACYLMFYDKDYNFIERKQANNQIVTSSSNAKFFRFSCYNYGQGTYDATNKPVSINWPSEDTLYHAFTGLKVIINLGDTYYGGYVDAVTGEIWLTCQHSKISEFSWSYNSQYGFMTTGSLSYVKQTANNEIAQNLKCDIYKADTASYTGSGGVNNTIAISNKSLRIRDNNYTDPSLWVADMGDYYIVLPLDEPVKAYAANSVKIPTIEGLNQLYCDSGDIGEIVFLESVNNHLNVPQPQKIVLQNTRGLFFSNYEDSKKSEENEESEENINSEESEDPIEETSEEER